MLRIYDERSEIVYETSKEVTLDAALMVEVSADFVKEAVISDRPVQFCEVSVKGTAPVHAALKIVEEGPAYMREIWSKEIDLPENRRTRFKARVPTLDLNPQSRYRAVAVLPNGTTYESAPGPVRLVKGGDTSSMSVMPKFEKTINPNTGPNIRVGRMLVEQYAKSGGQYTFKVCIDGKTVIQNAVELKKNTELEVVVPRKQVLFKETSDHLLEWSLTDGDGKIESMGSNDLNILSQMTFDNNDFVRSFCSFLTLSEARAFINSLKIDLTGYQDGWTGLIKELTAVQEAFKNLNVVYHISSSEFRGTHLQSIQPGDMAFRNRNAQCVEASLMKAAVYTVMGLDVAVLVFDGHVLPGIILPKSIKVKKNSGFKPYSYEDMDILPIEATVDDLQAAAKCAEKTLKGEEPYLIFKVPRDQTPFGFV